MQLKQPTPWSQQHSSSWSDIYHLLTKQLKDSITSRWNEDPLTASCKCYGDITWIQGERRNHKLVANTQQHSAWQLIPNFRTFANILVRAIFAGIVSFRLLSFHLLSFCLLSICLLRANLCHFAYWLAYLLCYFTENSWNTLWTLHVWFYYYTVAV